jgi:hypothetical protein
MLATCCCAPWKAGTGSRHGCLFFLVERHAARLAAVYVTCPPGTYWDLACCCRFLSSRQSAFRIRPPSNKGRRRGPRRPRVVHGLGLPPPPQGPAWASPCRPAGRPPWSRRHGAWIMPRDVDVPCRRDPGICACSVSVRARNA